MLKNITIESVEVKKTGTNEKSGKDWTLYSVKCSGDNEMKEFSTFDYKYKNSIGQQMQSNFEFNEKFRNWNEVSEKQAEASDKHEELLNGIRRCWDKIDEVEKLVDRLGVPRTTEPLTEEELKQDEINSQDK